MIRLCSCTGGSTSTCEISRKRTATASCKTCGGKPLVDGRVSTSGSMLGTVGLELTSFINSDLSWKVSKGSRSSSRRARKSVSTILKTGRDEDSKSVDMSISESEKLGVSVLGCRFSEKAEHVPIKKRKFLFRSPSPPHRVPSPCLEDAERLLKSQPMAMDCTASTNDLGQIVNTVQDVDEKNLGRVHGQLDENEDFSGISILAAAACSNSFGGDDVHAEEGSGVDESFAREGPFEVSINNESCSLSKGPSKEDPSSAEISTEGTGSCISAAVPAEELAACLRKDNSSINGRQHGNNMEDTPVQDHAIIHRSHWDLNTAMDAWGRPFNCQYADSTNVADGISEVVEDGNCSDKIGSSESYELKREPVAVGNKCEAEKKLPLHDSRGIAYETQGSNVFEHKLDACTHTDRASCLQEKLPSSEIDCAFKTDMVKGTKSSDNGDGFATAFVPADNVIESSVTVNVDKSALDHCATVQVPILDSCASNTLLPKPNHHTSTSKSDGSCDATSTDISSAMNIDGGAAGAGAGEILSSSFHVEKQDIMPPISLFGNKICETGDVEDAKEISGSHDGGNASKNMVLLETVQPFKTGPLDDVPENPVLQSDEVGLSRSSPIGVELPTSDAFVGHQMDTRLPHDKVPMHDDGEDSATKSSDKSTACKNNSDDDFVNSYDKMALKEMSEHELDYDSQYEDGEVRESIFHTWEEYDGEDVDAEENANNLGREAEVEQIMKNTCLTTVIDAGSGEITTLNGKDTRNEAVASDGAGLDKVTRDIEILAGGDYMKEASQSADSKMKMPGWEQVLESRRNSSKAMIGAGDCSSRKNINGDFMDCLDAEDTNTRIYGSRVRRDFHSRIEGRASRDLYFRKDIQGSSDAESFGRARYSQHTYARGQGGDRWVDSPDSRRGLKRHRSPNYHGPMSFRRHGLEDGVTGRQIMDASSHGMRRRLVRSGSPLDRDQAFILRMGFRPGRELSPGRRVTLGRGRSLRYGPRVDGRGPRGRYHGPVPDDCTESSLKKRERSFSPVERRGDPHGHQPRTKSPARSRTNSPNVGNPCPRRRSKSPSFRSEARMQRMRSPHTRPGFMADDMVGFRSMPRSHGSPPHNSKWVGDRKDGVVNFREQGYNQRSSVLDRRSPGRFRFNPRDRFDLVDSPRNYRPMHLGRFSEVDGVGRGRLRYEGSNDDEGKDGLRYGLVHPSKRFGYNAEDGFVGARNPRYRDPADFHGRGSPKDYGRGIDSRIGDVPSRFREERGPFIHRRDEKYNVDSKSFGMREGDDDIASRRRPS